MNKVDLHVRQLMLRSPSIFPNRWSVLEHIFLHIGTGYGWTRKGVVASLYEKKDAPVVETMDMSDLDEEAAYLEQSAARFKGLGLADTPDHPSQVALGMRRLQRQYIAANIDTYARSDLGDRGLSAKLLPSSLAGTPLGQVPSEGKVDRDWALAADEVILKLLGFLRQQLEDANASGWTAVRKEQYVKLSMEAREVLAALEPVTGMAARRQAAAKVFEELMAKT